MYVVARGLSIHIPELEEQERRRPESHKRGIIHIVIDYFQFLFSIFYFFCFFLFFVFLFFVLTFYDFPFSINSNSIDYSWITYILISHLQVTTTYKYCKSLLLYVRSQYNFIQPFVPHISEREEKDKLPLWETLPRGGKFILF